MRSFLKLGLALLVLTCFSTSILLSQDELCILIDDTIGDPPIGGFPSACSEFGETVFDLEVGTDVNDPNTDGYGTTFPTLEVRILGDFTIKTDFEISYSVVELSPGATIFVDPFVTLIIDNSVLFSCDGLWEGIVLGTGARIITRDQARIEDAEAAIQSINTSYNFLEIENTIFNRNRIGILLENDTPSPHSPFIPKFHGNTFSCSSALTGTLTEVSYAGLQITNVYSCFQQGSNQVYENSFVDQMYGIIASGNNTDLYLNDFDFSTIKQASIKFTGNNLEVFESRFTDIYGFGIYSEEPQSVLVEGSFFFMDNVPFQYTTRDLYHIYIKPKTNSQLRFDNNQFSITGPKYPQTRSTCIYVETEFSKGDYDFTTVNCEFNLLGEAPLNSNFLSPGTGIILLNRNQGFIRIEDNDFFGRDDYSTYARGISVALGQKDEVNIIGNTFRDRINIGIFLDGNTGGSTSITSNEWYPRSIFGVWQDNYDNVKLCDNKSFSGNRFPFRFGNQNFNTEFTKNAIYGSSLGAVVISIGNSFIGPQSHAGNEFFPTFFSNGQVANRPLIRADNENIAFMSRFTVHTPQSIFNGSTGQYDYFSEYHPDLVIPDSGPLEDVFFFPQFGGSPNLTCAEQTTPGTGEDNLIDIMIADGTFSSYITSPVYVWDAERYLYQKLQNDSDYAASDPAFVAFKTTHASTTIGQFYEIENTLASALEISEINKELISTEKQNIQALRTSLGSFNVNTELGQNSYFYGVEMIFQHHAIIESVYTDYEIQKLNDLSNILAQLQQITTSTSFEEDRKKILDAILNKALGNTLSEEKFKEIVDIARQCPDYGRNIYLARQFLSTCAYRGIEDEILACNTEWTELEETLAHTISTVDEELISRPVDKIRQNNSQHSLALSPNPVGRNDDLSIPTVSSGMVQFYDVTGNLVAKFDLTTGQNTVKLDLDAGLYFASIETNNGVVIVQKVVLTD